MVLVSPDTTLKGRGEMIPNCPSKEAVLAIVEANRLSGNAILGPLPRCGHGLLCCTVCDAQHSKHGEGK